MPTAPTVPALHPKTDNTKWLRDRFARPRPYAPETGGDGLMFHPETALKSAAVLVPVIARGAALTVLFTRRTAHLSDHAGQISFPGGRAEPDDASLADTALRETEEEIGLARRHIEVLGSIHHYVTGSGYRVTPVVGLVQPPFELAPDAREVAEVFEVPLAHLLDPANHQVNSVIYQGWERHYYAMPFGEYYIWGATAGMLMNFYRFVAAPEPAR